MVDESFRNVDILQPGWREDVVCAPMFSKYYPDDGGECWLALFEFLGDACFDLWVMKEYGVVESWTKLYNVHLTGSPEEEPCVEPFGLTKSGQVVVRIGLKGTLEEFKLYDPEDKQFKDFGKQGCNYYFMDSFVESLAVLGQINVFSY